MQIVIAAGIFPPDIGGPATYADAFARFLVSRKHSVSVLCYGDQGGTDSSYPYPVYRVQRGSSKLRTFVAYLRRLSSMAKSADGIYAQGPLAGGLQSFLVSRMLRIPYAVKITGDYAWEQAASRFGYVKSLDAFQHDTFALPWVVRMLRAIQNMAAKNAASCVVPSQYLKKIVRGWGIVENRVEVIYNAAPEVAVTNENTSHDKSMVLTVGRLVPWKGFATLIRVWPRVRQRVPDAVLTIAGSGPERKNLETLIANGKLESQVILAGQQTPSELDTLYAAASVFVLNSGYEGLSHTILEALAHGVPAAVSGSGGNQELITDGVSGLVFPYDDDDRIVDTVVTLLTDRSKAQQFATQALHTLGSFRKELVFEGTVQHLANAFKPSK